MLVLQVKKLTILKKIVNDGKKIVNVRKDVEKKIVNEKSMILCGGVQTILCISG